MAEDVRHFDQGFVGFASITLEERGNFSLIADVGVAGLLSHKLAKARQSTSLSILLVARRNKIIVHRIGFRALVLHRENPLQGGLVAVSIGGHAEETILLGLSSFLIEELLHLKDVAISIIFSEVIGSDSTD